MEDMLKWHSIGPDHRLFSTYLETLLGHLEKVIFLRYLEISLRYLEKWNKC